MFMMTLKFWDVITARMTYSHNGGRSSLPGTGVYGQSSVQMNTGHGPLPTPYGAERSCRYTRTCKIGTHLDVSLRGRHWRSSLCQRTTWTGVVTVALGSAA